MGCSKVIWAVIGAAVVIALITVPMAIYLKRQDGLPKRPFTLEDYFNDTIRYKIYNLRWISDYEYLHKTRQGNIMLHNAETGNFVEYISNKTFEQVHATDYIISADRKYICFESNYSKQWRHSYTASYSIYDYDTSTFINPVNIPQLVQYFSWAPTGNKLAYVWNYNVYLKLNATAEAIQVTHNGKENKVLNGVPDWVYEEEVFSSNEAIWWSPTGKFLAYAEFNDTEVHAIEYSLYGYGQYPKTMVVPYPKVRSCNVTFESLVVVPDSIGPSCSHSHVKNHFLGSVTWVTDERIAVQWTKRKQNHVVLQIYDFDGNKWNEKQHFEQISKTGWVGQYTPLQPMFAEDNISFYKVMSDAYGYKQLHYVKDGKATAITKGRWEVIYISKLTKDTIYYVSNEYQGRPGQRNVYKVTIGSSHSAPQCLTCDLYKDRCQYNSAYFSYNASYYRLDCYGPGTPLFTLRDNRGAELLVLRDNRDLEDMLKDFLMPTMQLGTLKVAGFDLWYQMMLPPKFQKNKKYPLLIDVYGGPGSQKADYRYRLNWGTYLSSTEGIIVASFDGRGSGYQGDKIMHSIYQRLGTFEVEDQITAVRKFIDMGFIDKERIAIWGWSYGGYVTSMALGSGSGLFKCGIAVAPVCKWEYYDSVYTERYMSKPKENEESYTNSTVTNRAKNFKSVDYLLVHGTADDNVHFQQSAQISKALVDQQVDFEAMWYTDKDHGLQGSAYHHVYTHMSHFLQKCLVKPK
uniref:Uncharacterized protein n=1 Tax=Esox lucius TaxID=8010 RepID=A0A6Q2YNP4_ESOLU